VAYLDPTLEAAMMAANPDPTPEDGVPERSTGDGTTGAPSGDPPGGGAATDLSTEQIRGSTLLFLGKLLTILIHFGSQVLIVRYLTQSEFGAFAYALSIVTLAQAIVTFGLDRAVTRFIPIYEERGERGKALGTLLLVASTVLSLGLAVLLIAIGFQAVGGAINSPLASSLVVILIVLAPIQALDSIMIGMFAVYAKPRAIFFRKYVLEPALRLIVVLALIGFGQGVRTLAIGYVVAGAIGVLAYSAILVRLLRQTGFFSRASFASISLPVREVFAFTIPILTSDLVYLAMNTSDAVLLGRFGSLGDVAAFKVVQPAARLNQLVFTSFSLLFTPVAARLFARRDRAGMDQLYWTTALWIAVLTFPIFVLLTSLGTPLTGLVYGERYQSSGTYLTLLSLGYYANAALGFNGLTLKVVGRVKYIVGINIAAAIGNVALNLLLIPAFGALGAAIGTTTTLLAFNALKHIGLRPTGVRLMPDELARTYAVIAAIPLALLAVQVVADPPIVVVLVLAGIGSLIVLRLARPWLRAHEAFPRLMKLRMIRWVIGSDR
jgi:O-antigen/teichoic acid export membrane protein